MYKLTRQIKLVCQFFYIIFLEKNQKGLYINVVTGTVNMGANKWKEDIDYLEDEYNLNNVIFDLDEQIQLS